jgi:hypothetical protein
MTTVSGLALLAGAASYHHMLALAERSGEYGVDAHAFPLTVDGLDLIGVLVLLADRRTGRDSGWLPWTVLTVGTLASITANIAVAPPNPIARAISGWSAVALLAAAKLLAHLLEPPPTVDETADQQRHLADRAPAATSVAVMQDAALTPAPAATLGAGGSRPLLPETAERPRPQLAIRDAARRVPASDAARTRWREIWQATCHLDHATADMAASHGVSLRTLQFIRAAGRAGHLPAPPSPPGGADTVLPLDQPPSVTPQLLQPVP